MAPTKQIAIFLFDGVEELDAVGPFEVLAAWTQSFPKDGYALLCISETGGPVRGAKGLLIGADAAIADAPSLAVLLHPGGRATRQLLRQPAHLDWVRAQRAATPLMTSVCTGSLVYAAAGLLTGRRATTHWSALTELAALDPSIGVDAAARYVDDGDTITSAGVSAGIDMALHVVTRFAGPERAREIRREIQYD